MTFPNVIIHPFPLMKYNQQFDWHTNVSCVVMIEYIKNTNYMAASFFFNKIISFCLFQRNDLFIIWSLRKEKGIIIMLYREVINGNIIQIARGL